MKPEQAVVPRSKELPPDPDGQNDDRAEWAGKALTLFQHITGTDREDAVCDILVDMMHYCDRAGFDFASELRRAQQHYKAETSKEQT